MAKMYLYHEEKAPKGHLFDVGHVKNHKEDLDAEGWVDTPKGFKLPPVVPEVTEKKAKNMAPDALVGLVRGMGFLVMTKEQFDAEVVKARFAEKEADAEEVEEAEETKTPEQIIEQFENDPESLTKEELIEYGNEMYDLGLTRSMKEATLISKIQEARG